MFAIVDIAGIDYRVAKIAAAADVGMYSFVTRKKFLEEKKDRNTAPAVFIEL